MTGYSQNEILGKNFHDLVAPEHLERLKENYQGKRADGVKTENIEMEILAKDKKKIPRRDKCANHRLSRPTGYHGHNP